MHSLQCWDWKQKSGEGLPPECHCWMIIYLFKHVSTKVSWEWLFFPKRSHPAIIHATLTLQWFKKAISTMYINILHISSQCTFIECFVENASALWTPAPSGMLPAFGKQNNKDFGRYESAIYSRLSIRIYGYVFGSCVITIISSNSLCIHLKGFKRSGDKLALKEFLYSFIMLLLLPELLRRMKRFVGLI